MEREYLFRGKTKETNEWVYGGIFVQDGRYFIIKSITYSCGAKSWGAFEVDPNTVSRCSVATEKQIKKAPVLIDGRMQCPACKSNNGSLNHYCNNCGQAIDWEDEF